jgi:hypothetical protein
MNQKKKAQQWNAFRKLCVCVGGGGWGNSLSSCLLTWNTSALISWSVKREFKRLIGDTEESQSPVWQPGAERQITIKVWTKSNLIRCEGLSNRLYSKVRLSSLFLAVNEPQDGVTHYIEFQEILAYELHCMRHWRILKENCWQDFHRWVI